MVEVAVLDRQTIKQEVKTVLKTLLLCLLAFYLNPPKKAKVVL